MSAGTAKIPTCAQVCPADAIKKGEDGVVMSALKPRCIACSNCVLACPFGIPKIVPEYEQMMKCDMCYDRTSVGKNARCAPRCAPARRWLTCGPKTSRARREKPSNVFSFRQSDDHDTGLHDDSAGNRFRDTRHHRIHVGEGQCLTR